MANWRGWTKREDLRLFPDRVPKPAPAQGSHVVDLRARAAGE